MANNLVRLREGTGRAVVCVHAAGGLVTGFRRVAPHLAAPGPVLALENVEPGPDELCSVQALARSYWGQVEPSLTDGLDLVGWSFGGAVAVEMAALAEAAGHRVGSVVLLDAAAPHLLRGRAVDPLADVAALFEVDAVDLPEGATASGVEEALEVVAAALAGRQQGITVDDLRPFTDVYAWHLAALRAGGPLQPPLAPVVLVRAQDESGWADAPPDLGWSQVLGDGPELRWAPGNHHSVVSQLHAPALASVLDQVLAAGAGSAAPR